MTTPFERLRHEQLHQKQEQENEELRKEQEAADRKALLLVEADQRRLFLKISQFLWLGFAILEGLIGLRIVLKLIAANPQNAFANFVYSVTTAFLSPFLGLTITPAANGVVVEISSIIALFVYFLLAALVQRLLWIVFSRPKV